MKIHETKSAVTINPPSAATATVIWLHGLGADGHDFVPIVPELGASGAPVVLTGIGLPDDRLHSPNEKLDLDQLWAGVAVFGRFLELFGERGGRRREGAAETAEEATA